MNADDLVHRFRFHRATEVTGPLHTKVRAEVFDLAEQLNELLPDSREKSLVITKLEEVMFWSNAAIARHTPKDDVLIDE